MYSMVRDGVETRYRDWVEGTREDRSFTFVEPHELAERWHGPMRLDFPELIQLRPNGASRPWHFATFLEEASAVARIDVIQGPGQLKPGEATEVYYEDRNGCLSGRIVLACIR